MAVTEERARRAPPRRPPLRLVVGVTLALGGAGALLLWFLQSTLPHPGYWTTDPVFVLALIGLALIGEFVYVPLRRGDGWEQLTFNNAVMALAAMVVPPLTALAASLVAVLLEELIQRRPLVKLLFNLGSYAVAATGLLATYLVLAGQAELFSIRSLLALLVAGVVFEALNLTSLAMIWWSVEGVPPSDTWREEMGLTVTSGVIGAGLAVVALVLWLQSPVLVPFAALPAMGLWLAFQSAARHTEARERSRWLVALGQAVSTPADPADLVPAAADALRRVFAAEAVLVRLPDGQCYSATQDRSGHLAPAEETTADAQRRLAAGQQPTPLPPAALPPGWVTGVGVRLDIGDPEDDTEPGWLLLGGTTPEVPMARLLPWLAREWRLGPEDGPVLAALAAALGSALRAGATLRALTEETTKLGAVVTHASDGIALLAPDGRFTMWSPAMARITGIDEQQAMGLNEVPEHLRPLRQAIGGGPGAEPESRSTVALTMPDGEERSLDMAVVWYDDQSGGGESAIVTVRDVTEQRRAERLKSDFISTVSHELRTPITPIKGYANLLLTKGDKVTPEKRQRMLQQISDRANQLAMLVEDLLLASRVSDAGADSARLSVDLQEVDACQVAESAVAGFPELAERISLELPEGALAVRADPMRAGQCVANLLSNAGKYSDPGTPIQVRVSAADAAADDGSQPDGSVAISVSDRGRGIPASEQERVFRRFYRVEDPMTMTTGGNGLGLFIARELARAMGGDITLVSESGVGSTFTLLLQPSSGGNSGPGGATLGVEGGPP